MNGNSWDGITDRRRRPVNAKTVEVPLAGVLVAAVCIGILQVAALVGHRTIGHDHDTFKAHNRSVTCYVVKVTQGEAGPDVLTDCDFIDLGTMPKKEE